MFLAHIHGVSSEGHTQEEEKPRASKEEKWLLCGIMLSEISQRKTNTADIFHI